MSKLPSVLKPRSSKGLSKAGTIGSVAEPSTVAAMATAHPDFEALKKGQSLLKLLRRLALRRRGV